MYKEIWKKIEQYDSIVIFGHVNPDGDCYGSQLGLKNAILDNYKDKKVYVLGTGLPQFFDLIGPMDEIEDDVISSSLAIVLDVANMARIEDQRFSLAKEIIKIDHHLFQESFGVIELINNDKIAACEIVAELIIANNGKLSKESARPLFLGIVTDSGRFVYEPTSYETFETVSKLLATGFDFHELYNILYAVDEETLRFKGYIFLNYKKTEHGVAYLKISKETCHEFNVNFNKAASLVNSIGDLKGSPIWVFFAESDEGLVRVELRSKGYSVQPTAVRFGGGGHLQASGCRLESLDQADLVLKDLDEVLAKGVE